MKWFDVGRPAKAVEAWKEALTLDPDNLRARAALDEAERYA
jgi:hypothetical protein